MSTLQTFRRHRKPFGGALAALMAVWQIGQPLLAVDQTWNNSTNDSLWGTTGNWTSATPTAADNVFLNSPIPGGLGTITLGAGSLANLLTVRNNYTLTGGDLTLTTGGIRADVGTSSTINSQLLGSAGLTLTGGGSIRLTNGSYTGTTTITNGSLIINSAAALGGTGTVSILSTNNTPSNTNTIAFGAGSLVLDGTTGGFTFSRAINFEGRGPIGDRGAAIQSLGNNTLSGVLTSAVSPLAPATFRNSRINSVNGALTISGTLNVGGVLTAGTDGATVTTITSLGGVNTVGVGNFNLTGTLAGTGTLEKTGSGTLFLTPASTSGFTGAVRTGASSVGQQSSIRVTQLLDGGTTSVFGANTVASSDVAAIDLNGGVLEFRSNSNLDFNALTTGKNTFLRATTIIYTGPAGGGDAVNGLTTLGTFRVNQGQTATFRSRNGYGMTLQAWTQESTAGNTAIANEMGGTLTFTGDAWNNNSTSARNLTFSGNGNTRIVGNITATDLNKQVIKQGTGELAINGVAGTFTGATSIQGGAVRITDFRSINNNTVAINLGDATTVPGALIIGGTGVGTATAAGLTTSKPIFFNNTTAQSTIYANQAALFPVILNGAITSITTTGNYNLGGSSTQDNIINVALPAGTTGGLTKLGIGTWVLNAANLYTGATTIQGGTLKLRATGTASNVILETATNLITFTSQGTTQTAGGTLEFRGDATGITTETLGALTPTAGASTVRLLGQGGFASNLIFNNATAALGATTAATSVNFDTTGALGGTVSFTGVAPAAATATTLPGTANFQGHLYVNGANFADIVTGVVTTPTYAAAGNFQNAGAALIAAVHNRLTGATASGAATISSLLTNNQTLTLSGNLIVSTGGILQSGGTASIVSDSATARLINQTGTAATNVAIRVDLSTDTLNLGSATNPVNIGSFTTGGLTKNGAGELVVFGTNAQAGTTTINEGTVELNGTNARLAAAAGTNTVVRQNAFLEFNTAVAFAANPTVAALDGAGTIRNVGAANVTIVQTGAGTWAGSFNQTGAGTLSVSKLGTTGAPIWQGVSNYTGVTTIGGTTGSVTVDVLANGGVNSGIGASSNAASNLVFSGTTAGIDYRGSIIDNALTLGSRSATTDRLFTLAAAATGANLTSTVTNNNAIVWSNTGAIVNNTTANATLTLAGASTGDNTLNPQLVNSSVGGITLAVTKSGAGQWNLGNSTNSYTGLTTLNEGILGLNSNGALATNSPLVLAPTSATSVAVLQMSGNFVRNLTATPTAGTGDVNFGGTIASTTGGVGFAAHSTELVVAIGGLATPTALTWGSGGFVGTAFAQNLVLNSTTALSSVDFRNAINLNAAVRTINVLDNNNTGADYATLSGVLSGAASSGLLKIGAGVLRLEGANSYAGTTGVEAGTLVVSSLGSSTGGPTSSVGAGGVAMDNTNAIVLGNATTTGGNLQYVGPGETSDRKIRLRGTTANSAIYADGAGPLVLTNVAHDTTETGNKILSLRGTNAGGNMITSVLSDNGVGTLNVTVDGGATWILTNSGNSYTGGTTASAGALGIGDNAALGSGTLTFNNGNIFASGADRTLTNAVTHNNNTNAGFFGDYNLTFNAPLNLAAGANNANTTTNNIVAGKALTFAGGVTANSLTANRVWAIDGTGETIINGTYSTSTAFGVRFDIQGGGTLTLGTNGATSNFNQSITAADVDRGTLKFSVNNAIPTAAALGGGVTLTPELATGDTATLDLNGTIQTLNAFTATTDGTSIITNSAVGAATLIVGANNNAATFGTGGTGTYSITQPSGVINLTKIGSATANFTGTLGNTGTVTSNGGVLNINSTSLATAAVGDGGQLNFKGGFTTPGNLLSVTTNNGGLVSFANGAGTPFANLTNLNLSLTANAGLELDVGDTAIDKLTSVAASVANVTTLFIKDIDITGGTTYDLIVNAAGGLGVLGNYALNLPGYSGSTLTVSPTLVQLNAGTLITSDVYWNNGTGLGGGTLTQMWNTVDGVTTNINFSGLVAGTPALQLNENLPGKGQKVIFQADNLTGGAPLATTLEQSFTVNTLEFRPSTTAANTSRTISIAPGASVTNSLTIKPSLSTDGINLQTGAAGTVSISAPFVAGAAQTWTVADAPVELTGGVITGTTNVAASTTGLRPGMTVTGTGIPAGTTILAIVDASNFTLSQAATNATVNIIAAQQLNLSGALSGAGNVTKAGAGVVVLSGANGTLGGTYTSSAGITQVSTLSALGGQVGVPGSGADITVSGGSFFYNNATAGTFVNDFTLSGGTLASGGQNQTYSGNVNVSANSTVSLRDQAAAGISFGVQRNVTLSGVVSGAGRITLDSLGTLSAGNQLGGTLTLSNANPSWSGGLAFNRGSVTATNVSALGTGPITATLGRITYNTAGGTTFAIPSTQTLNVNGAGSVFELTADASGTPTSDMTVNYGGAITLGSVANANVGLRLFQATDNFSIINIKGGIVLANNASVSVAGSTTRTVTIDTVGISETGGARVLTINDDVGTWAQTNQRLAINVASTYTGGTNLAEGFLLLGNKDALGTGVLTITGASTITPTVNISAGGVGVLPNAVTLNEALTVTGTENLTINGLFNATGNNASRTLTNNLVGGVLTLADGVNVGATGTTAARTFTVAGTGDTVISGAMINNTAFAHAINKNGSGTLTLSNLAGNVGGTTGNTFTGGSVINEGILRSGASNVLPNTGTITVRNNVGASPLARLDLAGFSDTIAALTFGGIGGLATSVNEVTTGAGILTLGGTVTVTNTGNFTTAALLSGNVNLGAARTFTVGDSTGTDVDLNVSALLSGAFTLTKSGAGVMLISNSGNSYGATTVNQGTLRSGANNVLPGNAITVNATAAGLARLDLAGFDDTIGSLTLGGTGGLATSVNEVITGAGTLTLGGNVATNAAGNPTTAPIISGQLALGATRSFTVADSTGSVVDLDVQAVVSGSGFGVTKAGPGLLQFSAANIYTGATTVNAGTLRYGVNSAINSGSAVTVNANAASTTATLDLNGFNGTVSSLTLGGSGQTATSASIVQTGAGTLTLGGNVTTDATGNPTTTPLISGNLALGASTRTFTVADSTGSLLDLDVTALVSGAGGIVKAGPGVMRLATGNTYGGATTINAGIITIAGDSALGTAPGSFTAGQLTLNGGALNTSVTMSIASTRGVTLGASGGAVLPDAGTTLTIDSAINGAGGLTLNGTGGDLILSGSGANTYTGLTTVTAGTLQLNKTGVNAIASNVGAGGFDKVHDILVNGGTLRLLGSDQIIDSASINVTSGTLNFNNFNETINNLDVSGGTVNFGTGDITIEDPTWSGGIINVAGNTTVGTQVQTANYSVGVNEYNVANTGTLTIGTAGTPGPFEFGGSNNNAQMNVDGTVRFRAGSTIDLNFTGTGTSTGSIIGAGQFNLNGSDRTFNIGDAAGSVVDMNIGVVISNSTGTAGILKTGAGTLQVTNANTFNGGTTASAGTLLVNNTSGSGTGTGSVTINPTATLAGSGIIAPTVTNASVSVQGLLNVGNSGDTAGADFVIDMSGSSGTLVIDLTGGVTLDYFSGQGTGVLNSPALSFNDQLGIIGNGATLNLGGNLTFNNFNSLAANTFTAGTTWSLFAWSGLGTVNGSFSNIAPGAIGNFTGFTDLSAELLGWDFTNLYTLGTASIVVIPEPSRAMLLLLGLLSLGFRRRRSGF